MRNIVIRSAYMNKILVIFGVTLFLMGCATVNSKRCLSYTVSGDNVAWSPTHFYQVGDDLQIELPFNTKNIPVVKTIDTEFDQTYPISYTYDELTNMLTVEDNYDKYLLERRSADTLSADTVYITCNRSKLVPSTHR